MKRALAGVGYWLLYYLSIPFTAVTLGLLRIATRLGQYSTRPAAPAPVVVTPERPTLQRMLQAIDDAFSTTAYQDADMLGGPFAFINAEMVDGPADGTRFPVPNRNPPPRVPFRTKEGIYWYLPERQPDQSLVLKWDQQPPTTGVVR